MIFQVEAIGQNKQKVEIEIDAKDRAAAISLIRSQGLLIVDLNEKIDQQTNPDKTKLNAENKNKINDKSQSPELASNFRNVWLLAITIIGWLFSAGSEAGFLVFINYVFICLASVCLHKEIKYKFKQCSLCKLNVFIFAAVIVVC